MRPGHIIVIATDASQFARGVIDGVLRLEEVGARREGVILLLHPVDVGIFVCGHHLEKKELKS
jgi:hypothetical protein